MDKSSAGITDDSNALCQALLDSEQIIQQNQDTCQKIQDRNGSRIVQEEGRLLVPSIGTLNAYGSTHLEHLIESVNQDWNSCIPLTVTRSRPRPKYSVGFRQSAFTDDQCKKLQPFFGGRRFYSYFCMATYNMYFPFFSCEVKYGAGGLDIADRRNADNMAIAVRSVVELFRRVNRENELHRKILAFSISHTDTRMRICGHYPLIDGTKARIYRYPIRTLTFIARDGKEKWPLFSFTKNIYEKFMPDHHKLICSAINDLPTGPDVLKRLDDTFASGSGTERDSEVLQNSESRHQKRGPGSIASSRGQNARAKKKNCDLRLEIEKLKAGLEEKEGEIDSLKDEVKGKDKEIELLQDDLKSLEEEKDEDIKLVEDEVKERDEEIASLEKELESVQEERDKIDTLKDDIEYELDILKIDLKYLPGERDREIGLLKDEIDFLEKKLGSYVPYRIRMKRYDD